MLTPDSSGRFSGELKNEAGNDAPKSLRISAVRRDTAEQQVVFRARKTHRKRERSNSGSEKMLAKVFESTRFWTSQNTLLFGRFCARRRIHFLGEDERSKQCNVRSETSVST